MRTLALAKSLASNGLRRATKTPPACGMSTLSERRQGAPDGQGLAGGQSVGSLRLRPAWGNVGHQKGYLGAGANKDHELAVWINQWAFSGLTVSRHQFANYLLSSEDFLLTARSGGPILTP